ncbi:MAG: ATP-dependent endonuclease [Sphingobacteriales bacterium]|nr:ATP-dependent endonuclease [Sphingobacteriales bacterium]
MRITKLQIKNFRLLKDVSLSLEDSTTVIVGRNNSGKTSLTEIFRRLLSGMKPFFSLHDFNVTAIERIKEALRLHVANADLSEVRNKMPAIEISITIDYDPAMIELGILGEFVVDLNPECHEVLVLVKYEIAEGNIGDFFEGFADAGEEALARFMKELKDRILRYFHIRVISQDPNDEQNIKVIDYGKFRQLVGTGFINAQRGLDDVTHTEKDVLGKVLAKLFKTANTDTAPEDMKEKSEALKAVVDEIQAKVDTDFNQRLDALLPALRIFGYPGLSDPNLSTETTIDIGNILDSHTRIRYGQGNGLYLPETYNGLGSRNLIYILFQLFEFFRDWQANPTPNGLYLIFIEEPEAHLHPQMQQVFIKQINQIAQEFARTMNDGIPWHVQFVITTHSTHIANEAKFDAIRYFLTTRSEQKEIRVKDLGAEFMDPGLAQDKQFLHKYLTLTKCDLYFADKAILVEGPTERILMPVFIQKTDAVDDDSPVLASQYISVIEVGGAYVHHFRRFLDFLELRTLVITDLDAVVRTAGDRITYPECRTALGTHTSNAGIKNWFDPTIEGHMPLADCRNKTAEEKVSGSRRIAYQIPETGSTCCGRSFEDAFMLANQEKFGLTGESDDELEGNAFAMRPKNNEKTNFAILHGVDDTEWNVPVYLAEGLKWLSLNAVPPAAPVVAEVVNVQEEETAA